MGVAMTISSGIQLNKACDDLRALREMEDEIPVLKEELERLEVLTKAVCK